MHDLCPFCLTVVLKPLFLCALPGVCRCTNCNDAAADDPEFDSPYVKAAREEGIDLPWWEKVAMGKFENGKFSLKKLTGGKLDDITVVVARVTDALPVAEEVPEEVPAGEDSESSAAVKPASAETETASTQKTEQQ